MLTVGMRNRQSHTARLLLIRDGTSSRAAMSGFITTMFVSTAHSPHVSFPAQPQPLVPVFTFAQSQSCMDLRMDLHVLDVEGKGPAGHLWSEGRPRETHQHPLQRIGEALGIPPQNRAYLAGTSLLSSFFSNPRTRAPFKPQKTNRGTSSWQLKQYAEATLGSGSLRKAVKLPEGEDKDEWLAVNGETKRPSVPGPG
jgi:hypothetical protein